MTVTVWLAGVTLALAASLALVPDSVLADQSTGSISIMDLTEGPITGRVVGGTLQVNQAITADKTTPETLSFSIDVDGSVVGGSGMAVLLEGDGIASDLLQLTVTPKMRGVNIPYFSASGTFMSDSDPGGLDAAALGITDKVIDKAKELKLLEDGIEQNIGLALVDPGTGKSLNIGGLSIMAASDIEEPPGISLIAPGLLALGMIFWRRSKRKNRHLLSINLSGRSVCSPIAACVILMLSFFGAIPRSAATVVTFGEDGDKVSANSDNLQNQKVTPSATIPELITIIGTTPAADKIDPGANITITGAATIGEQGTKVGDTDVRSDAILVLITGNGNGTSFVMADFQSDFENQLGKAKIDIVETGAQQTAPLTFIDSKGNPIVAPANFAIKFTSEATEVPEPSAWSVMATALLCLLGFSRRKKAYKTAGAF